MDFLHSQREILATIIEQQVERHLRLGGLPPSAKIDTLLDRALLTAQIYSILQRENVAMLDTSVTP